MCCRLTAAVEWGLYDFIERAFSASNISSESLFLVNLVHTECHALGPCRSPLKRHPSRDIHSCHALCEMGVCSFDLNGENFRMPPSDPDSKPREVL